MDINGQPTTDPAQVANYTRTATDANLSWYKKRLIDLGVSADDINAGNFQVGSLKSIPVTFGVKKNGDFANINFVERRDSGPVATAQTLPTSAPATLPSAQTQVPGMPQQSSDPAALANLV